MLIERRLFLRGLGLVAVASPAIVRAASLMPIRALRPDKIITAVWHVRADAEPGGDGKTWETAFMDWYTPMLYVQPGDTVIIRGGTYPMVPSLFNYELG